ncbi:MAG: hypothetical protein KC733_07515 [Candidatus Omnitrophica bacterium]|nr:hypothetical protein [Candidatus Omnitrophota bacterium]
MMKRLRFRRSCNPNKGRKNLAISSRTEDKECKTYIRKFFNYYVTVSQDRNPQIESPEIRIKKSFNSKRMVEKFKFQVKGVFYMRHKDRQLKVEFHHVLIIHIKWKSKNFSPKKSVSLTK